MPGYEVSFRSPSGTFFVQAAAKEIRLLLNTLGSLFSNWPHVVAYWHPRKRLTNLLAVFLGLAATTEAATALSMCQSKNIWLPDAIRSFCGRDFTVPSEYASTGLKWGPVGYGTIKVTGKCSPVQPVSKDVCTRQLGEVCLGGGPRGEGTRYFGRNGCQAWTIDPGKKPYGISPWVGRRRRGQRVERDVEKEI
ncbi:hypothetical protein M409DRAFT_60378 [Zasmidium cellare ATCC 36951]|uniref:Uncharacterized protein n=1 Tax=Zasmidium cellare ATCC 36951 TaxID=1080233 RepID=A0A6A6BZ37_ZASCE|nr:uncharacterized protein M409DRAFT_60378 [Zasmidium cellare ATCC 36951]KAF2159975.1 hypothetical protein M409DRAFT_60378 [Zasmidium cellare ATCC 36951]